MCTQVVAKSRVQKTAAAVTLYRPQIPQTVPVCRQQPSAAPPNMGSSQSRATGTLLCH